MLSGTHSSFDPMTSPRRSTRRVLWQGALSVVAAILLVPGMASASEVDVTSVVDVSAPTGSVVLAPGATGDITINMSVTGSQGAASTFKVNRDWTLSGGTFTGSNPQTFTVPARAGGDPPTIFSTTGHVTAAAGHAPGGPFTLTVGAFDPDSPPGSGGKLAVRGVSTYQVRVSEPTDTTPPVLTRQITGTLGANGWYTANVTVSWTVVDAESTAVIDSGCGTQPFTTETSGTTSSCAAHSAGGSSSSSVDIMIDKTGPSATLSPTGAVGSNSWYTSDVTVATSGTDSISGSVRCTADQLFAAETAGQTVNGSCTNGAGLTTNATPISIKIDKTGPSAVLTPSGTSGANGWYTSDVTVTTAGSDLISGSVTCTTPQTLVSETIGTLVNGSCTNGAGLKTDAIAITVKIDKTNPTASLAPSGTLGSDGWYISPVVVSTSGADTVSDPVLCTGPQTFSSDTTGIQVSGSCTNDAGLIQSAAAITIKIDQTAPTNVALSVSSGTAGTNGWYTSDVVVRTTGDEGTSGVTCSADKTISAQGQTIVTGHCTNGAGLTAYATPVTIKIDKTPPSATLAVSDGTTGANGWYTSNVTVSTSGSDDVSDPATCTAAQVFTDETASTAVNGSCTNQAGLTANAASIAIKIDKVGPKNVKFIGGIADGSSFYFGNVPDNPTCTATDSPSGIDSCVVTGYEISVGYHTLTATATDNAGNISQETVTYHVLAWDISGFYQPVSMDTETDRVINVVKNGSTVPLKFELFAGSNELTSTSAVTGLKAIQTNCVTTAAIFDAVDALATGGTSLRYDATGGQFIYNWKTPSRASTCWDVTVLTADGSGITAHFKLK